MTHDTAVLRSLTRITGKSVIACLTCKPFLRDFAALSYILLLVLLFFKNGIVDGLIYVEPDTTTFYYPVMSAAYRALNQFGIPLWTPYIFGGFPLFADGEAGMLYPPNLLLMWLLPVQQALLWGRVVRFFLGGSFMYAYLRSISVSRISSLLGAIVFTLGSFLVTQLHHANVGNSAIWLPLILFWLELALANEGRRRILYVLFAGLALGVQSLGVHVQPVLLTFLVITFYVPFRTLFCGRAAVNVSKMARLRLAAMMLALLFAVGLGLAAVQLLPLYELGTFSFRGEGTSFYFATSFSLPIQNIVTIILPYFFIRPDGSSWSLWVEWESTVYIGIVPLILAVLASTRVKQSIVLFYVTLAVVSLLLAFGDYLPVKLYWLVWNLPGFSALRAPARFSYLFVLSSGVLAGYGLDFLTRAISSARAPDISLAKGWQREIIRLISAAVASAVFLIAAIVVVRAIVVIYKQNVVRFIEDVYLTMRNHNAGLSPDTVYAGLLASLDLSNAATLQSIVLLVTFALVLGLWWKFVRLMVLWRLVLLGIVSVDLLVFAVNFHPTATWETIATPSGAVQFLMAENGLHRVYQRRKGLRLEPNRLLPFRVSDVGGYSSLETERNKNFVRAIEKGSVRLLDLWNVRFIVGKAGDPPLSPSHRIAYQDNDVVIYENASYWPRAFIVDSYVVAASGSVALEMLQRDDLALDKVVILEEEPRVEAFDDRAVAPSYADARVHSEILRERQAARIDEYGRERVQLTAESKRGAFLVLTDSYYPGWRARVDDREAKIYRADYLFRAIYIPPGVHRVEFTFSPLEFELGRDISLATLVAVAITCIVLASRGARQRTFDRGLLPVDACYNEASA